MTKKNEVLIMIDMLKGFLDKGPLADPSIKQIIPENVKWIKKFIAEGKPVLSFQDAHDHNALEFENYPPHCLKGTKESELVDELMMFEDHMIKIEKNTTNGFFAPGFQKFLTENPDLNKITITGCCTDICVMNFAITMKTYCQTIKKPIEIIVIEKAVDTFGIPGHDKIATHQSALGMMRGAGILIQ
jgi:nicotinamidase-related amidase